VTSRVNTYRAAVVAALKASMPALKECTEQFGRFNLEELETSVIKCPAVRVAVLSTRILPEAGGQPSAALSCAAFVVTEGKDRDPAAWTIAEAIAVTLHPAQLFGMTKLSAPTDISIQPVVTGKLRARSISIIAVEWRQHLRNLGAAIWNDQAQLLEELYVNDDPVELPEAETPADG